MFARKTEEILLIVMSEKCNGMLQYNINTFSDLHNMMQLN
jgi:hypothetical protein